MSKSNSNIQNTKILQNLIKNLNLPFHEFKEKYSVFEFIDIPLIDFINFEEYSTKHKNVDYIKN